MSSKGIYKKLAKRFLPKYKGRIIAIEPNSGKYIIGRDELSVAKKALERFRGRLLDFYRLGAPAVHKFRKKSCFVGK